MENKKSITSNTTINSSLEARVILLEHQLAETQAKLNWYQEQHRLSQHIRFGSSSERTHPDQLILLFNEVEQTAKPLIPEPELETLTLTRSKKSGKRKQQLDSLPVETVRYTLEETDKICNCCSGPLHLMSTEVRKELKVIPAQVKVVEHIRDVFGCRKCEREGTDTPIVTAPMPVPAFPYSLASPSAVAHIMSQKYSEGMPLYRQEKQWARFGIELSRQNMSNWVLYGVDRWLNHVYNRMHEYLLQSDIIMADETPLQVLNEPDRPAQTNSYMWLYRTGREGPPIVLFEYKPTRAGANPESFLAGFRGYLQVDGYSGYNKVLATLVGCWAHAKRKFDVALKKLPDSAQASRNLAKEGLDFCNRLYQIDRKLKNSTAEERYENRREECPPVMDAFLAWLEYNKNTVVPKSGTGEAITYCLNQWAKLNNYLKDGRLEIDNNRSERSIKPFVIGRKAWLFSNTPKGAEASAVVYSIVETAKENKLNPFFYLTYLFEKLPNIDTNDKSGLDNLLPWSEAIPADCRVPK